MLDMLFVYQPFSETRALEYRGAPMPPTACGGEGWGRKKTRPKDDGQKAG